MAARRRFHRYPVPTIRCHAASSAPPSAIDPDAPNLYTAVEEQLGLKLESARGRVEVVVIDEFEKPTLD